MCLNLMGNQWLMVIDKKDGKKEKGLSHCLPRQVLHLSSGCPVPVVGTKSISEDPSTSAAKRGR